MRRLWRSSMAAALIINANDRYDIDDVQQPPIQGAAAQLNPPCTIP